EDAVERPGGEGARGTGARPHRPGRHPGAEDPRAAGRPDRGRAAGGRGMVAAADGPPPAAPRLPYGGARRPRRRPAPQPREVGHRRIALQRGGRGGERRGRGGYNDFSPRPRTILAISATSALIL